MIEIHITDATIKSIVNKNGTTTLIVIGFMKSDAGNTYAFVVNDAHGVMNMAGSSIKFLVSRQYTDVTAYYTTVKKFKNSMKPTTE